LFAKQRVSEMVWASMLNPLPNFIGVFKMWFEFRYTDGTSTSKYFNSVAELCDFINNEGDHLIDYSPIVAKLSV
jgi:hypothetical protein